MIHIHPDNLAEFKEYVWQDGLQFEVSKSKARAEDLVVTELTHHQTFIVSRDIWESVCIRKELKYDQVIFGKDSTENVVSIEPLSDGQIILYKEVNGIVEEEIREFKPFILTNKPLVEKSEPLEGKQYYRWLTLCDDEQEYKELKGKLYKRNTDFYTAHNLKENYMLQSGVTYFKGLKPKDVSVLSFDIETNGLTFDENSEVYLITNTFRQGEKIIRRTFDIFDYHCRQQDMIEAWCEFVRDLNPAILLGHNVFIYDLKWLDHVSKNGLKLGRDGSNLEFATKESLKRKDGSQSYKYFRPSVFGREIIDTFFMSITYDVGRKYDSYSLKQIIRQEGLEKKDRTFIDAGKIREVFYKIVASNFKDQEALKEWTKVRDYAEDDSDDALKLFDLMSPALFYFTQTVPKSFQSMNETATGSQMNSIMVRSYLQKSWSIPKADETNHFEGAISLGVPGIYSNALKWDVASLYPSIMRHYKIFDKYKDPLEHFVHITNYYATERLKNKKLAKETGDKYYKDMEQTQKVGANSLYGFLGAPGLNFNYPTGAALVTRKGREILEKAIEWATGKDSQYWKSFNEDQETDSDE